MRIGNTKILLCISISFLWLLFLSEVLAQEPSQQAEKDEVQAGIQKKQEPEFVGEFFDTKVPIQNYYFIKSVLAVFGYRGALQPKAAEEAEKYIWEQLLLSYEAFRRGITVEQKDVDEEIRKILQAEKAAFDWKQDKDSYEKWVKEKVNEPAELFENQLRHLLQIERLRRTIMESIVPKVSEKEAYQEFLNEHHSLGVELVEFDTQNDADKFYRRVKKNPQEWDEGKAKRPADFKRIGTVSLEFLIDMWRFPRDALYKMILMRPGSLYAPFPMYKGYGVCKVLGKGLADKRQYKKLRESYYEQIRGKKRYVGLGEWLEDLKARAKIKVYEQNKKEEERKNE